jgi:hypothetical protein
MSEMPLVYLPENAPFVTNVCQVFRVSYSFDATFSTRLHAEKLSSCGENAADLTKSECPVNV